MYSIPLGPKGTADCILMPPSTLVLTTASKYFVDVRIFLPSPNEATLPTPTILPLSRLEWGFAGTATSTPAAGPKPAHTVWSHWVDSKTKDEVKDEGDMYPQSNGEVLEYGAMVNPAKDIVEKYEECWVDLDPVVVGDEGIYKSWTLRSTEGEGSSEVRGMVIRIGQYIQGVVRRGDTISIGRWIWRKENGWEKVAGIGSLELPESSLQRANELKLGTIVEGNDGLTWECIESFDWS